MAKRSGPVSSTSLWAKRGDPWLTEKEAVKDFGRVPAFEKPDLEQFTAAHKARHDPAKVSLVTKSRRLDKNVSADPQKKLASIIRRMNDKLHKLPVNNREHKKALNTDQPDFTPPPHHVGVDLYGRDLKTAKETAKGKRKRKRKK